VPSTCRLPAITSVPVLSPTAAGSIVNVAGPRREPVRVVFANVGLSVVPRVWPPRAADDTTPDELITSWPPTSRPFFTIKFLSVAIQKHSPRVNYIIYLYKKNIKQICYGNIF